MKWWSAPESPGAPAQRVYDDLFTGDVWLEEHMRLHDVWVPPQNADLLRAVIGLMFWSDATHFTQFGQAKLHPVYMGYGNQPRWERAKKGAFHHMAYLPRVRNLSFSRD